jgi:hypothetical protein
MKHTSPVVFTVVVGLALALHGTATAGPVWALDWPSGIALASFTTPSGRSELDVTFLDVQGDASTPTGTIANLELVHHGAETLSSGTITKDYAFRLRLTDLASVATEMLRFTGYLRAIVSPRRTEIENVLTSPATLSDLHLGDNIYTLSLGPFVPPNLSGSVDGSLGVRVTYEPVPPPPTTTTTTTDTPPESGSGRPPVNSTSEPSSLFLGCMGCCVVGLATWGKRRKG